MHWGNRKKVKKNIEASELCEVKVSKIKSRPRRDISEEALVGLSDSIKRIGLQNPISLKPIDDPSYKYEVIAGDHRFLACKRSGVLTVPARILSGTKAKLQQHSENLHRVELTLLQKYEDIAGYQKTIAKSDAKDSRGGVQRHDKGVSKTARELKTSRKKVQSALKASKLEPVIKTAITSAGLANNASFIDRIAKLESPKEQERELRKARSKSSAASKSSRTSRTTGVTFAVMMTSWRKSRTSRLWRVAPLTERQLFVDHIQADSHEEDTDD